MADGEPQAPPPPGGQQPQQPPPAPGQWGAPAPPPAEPAAWTPWPTPQPPPGQWAPQWGAPPPPRSNSGCLKVALIVGGILAALAIVAVVAFVVLVDRVDEELDEVGTRTVDGVETNSGNEQNPPPRDVELERCFTDDVGDVAAEGTAKNNTSETSSYTIEVTFHAGGRRIAGGNAFLAGVEPGETATWQASDPTDAPAEFDCQVQVVNRFASS